VTVRARSLCLSGEQVLELLVRLLRSTLSRDNRQEFISFFSSTFDVMYAYLLGNSRKNKAYFLRYLHFFQHQFKALVRLSPHTSVITILTTVSCGRLLTTK